MQQCSLRYSLPPYTIDIMLTWPIELSGLWAATSSVASCNLSICKSVSDLGTALRLNIESTKSMHRYTTHFPVQYSLHAARFTEQVSPCSCID